MKGDATGEGEHDEIHDGNAVILKKGERVHMLRSINGNIDRGRGRECIPATSANNTESSPSKKDLQLGKNSAPRDVDESRSEGVQDLSSAGH